MQITSLAQLHCVVAEHDMVLVYFSQPQCNVCRVLKPKVKELLSAEFPLVQFAESDALAHAEVAGQMQVFALPALLLFVEGKEAFRLSRNVGVDQLRRLLERPYGALYR